MKTFILLAFGLVSVKAALLNYRGHNSLDLEDDMKGKTCFCNGNTDFYGRAPCTSDWPLGSGNLWCLVDDDESCFDAVPAGPIFISYEACKTASCTSSEFSCADGSKCIPESDKCDGNVQCFDGSDEAPSMCGCKSEEFKCPDEELCIPEKETCNAKTDCKDGSDEENCSPVNECGCLENQQGCNCGFSWSGSNGR